MNTSGKIRIVLADDHKIVRQGFHALLRAENDLYVIGEADDGLEAIELVRELKPHILIMDLMMPGLNGLEAARQIPKASSQTKVIILSMYDDEGFVLEALQNGVAGYVLKDAGSNELIDAIREVRAGHRYLSSTLSNRAIEVYEHLAKGGTTDKYETLTTREREVFQLSAEGRSNSEIAELLGISVRTAETHRGKVMQKLGVHSQAELTRYAVKRGIISMK